MENYRKKTTLSGRLASWHKAFIASFAGALLGCSVFAGTYFYTTNLINQNTSSEVATVDTSKQTHIGDDNTNTYTTEELVAKVKPASVTVLTGNRMRNLTGNGSGVVYQNVNGAVYILTNAHVVSDAAIVEIYRNDLGVDAADVAEVVAMDTELDIAILRVQKPTQEYPVALAFGDSTQLREGQKVLAIGSPYVATLGSSFSGSVTEGIISGLNRTITDSGTMLKSRKSSTYIQIDAAINGGNSGGALIDLSGHLIGINSAKINSADNIGLAIPTAEIIEAMEGMNVPLPNIA